MPKVPFQGVSDQPLRPLAQDRQSSAGATVEAFGGGYAAGLIAVGQGLSQVGNLAQQVRQDIRAKDREISLTNNLSTWDAYKRDRLTGTADAPGYFSNKGPDAIDKAPQAGADLTEFQRKTSESILDPVVRASFDRQTLGDLDQQLTKIGEHTLRARDESLQATRLSYLQSQIDNITADPNDPNVAKESIENSRLIITNMMASLGFHGGTPEERLVIEKAVKEQIDKVVSAAVISLNRDDSTAASRFLDEHAGEITGETLNDLREKVKDGSMTEYAQKAVDTLFADPSMHLGGDLNKPIDAEKVRKTIRDTAKGKQEEGLLKELQLRLDEVWKDESREETEANRVLAQANAAMNLDTKQRAAEYRAVDEQIHTFIANGEGSYADFRKVHPDLAVIADQGDTQKYDRAYAAKIRGDNSALVSEPGLLARLTVLSQTELAKIDPNVYQFSLTAPDQDKLSIRIQAAKSNVEQKQGSAFRLGEAALRNIAPTELKWRSAATDDGMEVQRQDLRDRLNTMINDEINAGRAIGPKEIQEMASQVVLATHVSSDPSGLFNQISTELGGDVPKPIAEWSIEERAAAVVPFELIPTKLMARLKIQVINAGLAPEPELISQLAGQYTIGLSNPEFRVETLDRMNELLGAPPVPVSKRTAR